MKRCYYFAQAVAVAAACLTVQTGAAATIGSIGVFYNSTAPPGCTTTLCSVNNSLGVLDGAVFVIQNASATAITSGVLSFTGPISTGVVADSFAVGTIAANSNVVIEPGITNDGGTHPASGMFHVNGGIFDESDANYPGNATFLFTGLQGSTVVESEDLCSTSPGSFTPACTVQPLSNDGAVANINFLGGPGNNDGPCNNCWGPGNVANLVTLTTPEPSTLPLAGLALVSLGSIRRYFRRNSKRSNTLFSVDSVP